jgi:hypothetical protein
VGKSFNGGFPGMEFSLGAALGAAQAQLVVCQISENPQGLGLAGDR